MNINRDSGMNAHGTDRDANGTDWMQMDRFKNAAKDSLSGPQLRNRIHVTINDSRCYELSFINTKTRSFLSGHWEPTRPDRSASPTRKTGENRMGVD